MNNSQLCHAFAHQVRPSGRGSNLYYDGPRLYSYGPHHPLAELRDGFALLNPRRVSITTTHHASCAAHALSHLPIFRVPPDQWPKVRGPKSAERLAAKAAAQAAADEKEARRDAARRRRETAKKQAQEEADTLAALAAWRDAGGPYRDSLARLPFIVLRVHGDRVETSRGAHVSLRAARAVFARLDPIARAEEEQPSGKAWFPFWQDADLILGHFRGAFLRRTAAGEPVRFRMGCHEFPWTEARRILQH